MLQGMEKKRHNLVAGGNVAHPTSDKTLEIPDMASWHSVIRCSVEGSVSEEHKVQLSGFVRGKTLEAK